jgi:hypothetical protein
MGGMNFRRALEEYERGQRLIIRRSLVEAGGVRVGHPHPQGAFPCRTLAKVTGNQKPESETRSQKSEATNQKPEGTWF